MTERSAAERARETSIVGRAAQVRSSTHRTRRHAALCIAAAASSAARSAHVARASRSCRASFLPIGIAAASSGRRRSAETAAARAVWHRNFVRVQGHRHHRVVADDAGQLDHAALAPARRHCGVHGRRRRCRSAAAGGRTRRPRPPPRRRMPALRPTRIASMQAGSRPAALAASAWM